MPGTLSEKPLKLIVGEYCLAVGNYSTYEKFRAWVVNEFTPMADDAYCEPGAVGQVFEDAAHATFPHLLDPCECGIYLPLADIEPGPMLASAVGLHDELVRVGSHRKQMDPDIRAFFDALVAMTERCLELQQPLEIR